ncbi:nucleolar protein 12 [Onthophagus taurus]|uniref:nucleolar protein 12 n=1 Tax=Onthophagus taurus TaxID=166361 RepID=UPI0039BE2E34
MPSNKKVKKRKINLVFDEDKRREFLTGFHKRKLQRKKEAQEKLEAQLKEERKRLKKEAKESYKKLVVSNRDIVLEHVLEEEYDDEEVTVKITEITAEDIAKKSNKIGFNHVQNDDDDNKDDDEVDNEKGEDGEIPGMELKLKKNKNTQKEDKKMFNSIKDVKKSLKKIATQKVKKSIVFKKKGEMERKKMLKKSLRKKKENLKLKNKHKNNSRIKSC